MSQPVVQPGEPVVQPGKPVVQPGEPVVTQPGKQEDGKDDFSWLTDVEPAENRYIKKMKQNPFVPIGCLATVAALVYGLVNFKRGNMVRSQLAMRLRVLAQGGTIIALLGGFLLASRNK